MGRAERAEVDISAFDVSSTCGARIFVGVSQPCGRARRWLLCNAVGGDCKCSTSASALQYRAGKVRQQPCVSGRRAVLSLAARRYPRGGRRGESNGGGGGHELGGNDAVRAVESKHAQQAPQNTVHPRPRCAQWRRRRPRERKSRRSAPSPARPSGSRRSRARCCARCARARGGCKALRDVDGQLLPQCARLCSAMRAVGRPRATPGDEHRGCGGHYAQCCRH